MPPDKNLNSADAPTSQETGTSRSWLDAVRDSSAMLRLRWMVEDARDAVKEMFKSGPKTRQRQSLTVGGGELLESRLLMSATPAEIRVVDAEGNEVQAERQTVTETVEQPVTIDLSTLQHGTHPELWSTNIPGLGNVTMWMEGGVKIDEHGISAVTQPEGGTGFWFRFDDGPVTLLSVDTDFNNTNPNGMFRVVSGNDYVRVNGSPLDFTLNDPSFDGRSVDRLDEGQNHGFVSLRSITVQKEVQQTTEVIPDLVSDETAQLFSTLFTEEAAAVDTGVRDQFFSAFGEGTHTESVLSARLQDALAPFAFTGDGGVVVGADGSITSKNSGSGHGDWSLDFDALDVNSVTLNVIGTGQWTPFVHVIKNGQHQYINLSAGLQTIELNATGVTSISVSTGDRKIELKEMNITLPESARNSSTELTLQAADLTTAVAAAGLTEADLEDLSVASVRSLLGIRPELEPGAARLSATTDQQNVTTVTLDSPYDETWLVTPIGTLHFSHPGGAQGLTVFSRNLNDGALVNINGPDPRVRLTLYADAARTVEIDHLSFLGNPTNGVFTQETADHEEQPERWTDPELQVVLTQGAAVTVAYGTPYKNAVLEIAGGGGLFSSKQLSSNSPLSFGTETLIIDGSAASGTYMLRLLDRSNGTVLKEIPLVWDASTKTLTCADGIAAFSPFASVELDANDAEGSIASALAQEAAQTQAVATDVAAEQFIGTFGGAIQTNVPQTPQGTTLLEAQRMALVSLAEQSGHGYMVSRDVLWARFTAPGSTWENRTFATDAEAQEFGYQRNAEFTRYTQYALGSYEHALCRMMESAMNVVLRARRGESTASAMAELEAIPSDPLYSDSFTRLAELDVHLPSATALIEAAESILHLQAGAYKTMLGSAYADARQLLNDWNSPTYAGGGSASPAARSNNGFNTAAWGAALQEAALMTKEYFASIGEVAPSSAFRTDAEKIFTNEGDVLSAMTTDTLTRISRSAESNRVSAVARGDTANAAFFQSQKEAAEGLLGLIPYGYDSPVIPAGNTVAQGWVDLISKTTSDPVTLNGASTQLSEVNGVISLGSVTSLTMKDFKRELSPGVPETFTFTLTQESMVNFGIRNVGLKNLDLEITSGSMSLNYEQQHRGTAQAESMSLRLGAGNYTITMYDRTNYAVPGIDRTFICDAQIQPFNSANIEGMMSIDGNASVMPVRMRVAEFITD